MIMQEYTLLYGYNDGRSDSKTLHFHNDLIAMIEAPMFAIGYDHWLLMDAHHNAITRYMPMWGDTKIVNNIWRYGVYAAKRVILVVSTEHRLHP